MHLCPLITLGNQEPTAECVQEEVLQKKPLSITPGGSLVVNGCVTSQTPEDFTAHPEMHPLKHIPSLMTHLCNQEPTASALTVAVAFY